MIDLAKIRHDAKAQWISEQRRKVSFLEQVDQSVPWWLVVIAATLFILSAPHTASTFARLTPIAGVLAPLFVEFGLLYAAFQRKKLAQRGEKIPFALVCMDILLFGTAVIVNGAGALTAVVVSVNLADLPFGDMLGRFGLLPATSQVSLFLVPVAALIIPIGTAVAGEGLAALILERQRVKDDTDERWAQVEGDILYHAFFDALIADGCTPGKARKLAEAYAGKVEMPESGGSSGTNKADDAKAGLARGEARAKLDAIFRDDPAAARLPVETLMELSGAQKSAVYDWRKLHSNGHHPES